LDVKGYEINLGCYYVSREREGYVELELLELELLELELLELELLELELLELELLVDRSYARGYLEFPED
jgi:hypothetical protein